MKKPGSASSPQWYKDALIYELHVRSFADSNGDGIGDFPGLTGKLDYLQDLGVTCLWLLPFFPSPMRDDGYDISDYTGIHSSYGTQQDFQQFLDAAHQRGMQVLIELVMNHTSDMHPWFQRARRAPAGSPERDFYVWSADNNRFDGVPIIFNDTEKSNWAWDPLAGEYYWHRFFSHQPDLNYDNPQVLEEMLDVIRFWLDAGVDALRLDAIPYLVERDGTRCENLPETHAIIRKVRSVIDAEYADRFLLAEANQWPSDVRPYFGNGDECHMAFHFPLMPRMYFGLRQEDSSPIIEVLQQTPEIPASCQWGLFLRNHDELTLEMVTQDEREYMYLAYSVDPRTRINLGIRRRLAPLLDNNRQRIELLTSLLFSFPGTPILYYGDEIGMGDNLELGDRNGVRTPMQWNAGPNGGFSTADPATVGNPVIADTVYGYQAVNVQEQLENPSSLLMWTRNMVRLRKLFPVFGRGTLRFLFPANRKVLAYLRQLGEETVLCVANLSRFAQPVTLDLSGYEGRTPVEMIGYTPFPVVDKGLYGLTLSPYAFLWFELQKGPVDKRSDPVLDEAPGVVEEEDKSSAPDRTVLEVAGKDRLLVSIALSGPGSLQNAVQAFIEDMKMDPPQWCVTLAFPIFPSHDAGEDANTQKERISALIPGPLASSLRIAPYVSDTGAASALWPRTIPTYSSVCRLAEEQHASAVLLLGDDGELQQTEDRAALARAVLRHGFDLAMPLYRTSRYEGLVNSGVLYPLTRALYGTDIRFPLAEDIAVSTRFCQHMASSAHARAQAKSAPILNVGLGPDEREKTLWPSIEAALHGYKMAQIRAGMRRFHSSSAPNLKQSIAEILNSLFSEAERTASFWQKDLSPVVALDLDAESTEDAHGQLGPDPAPHPSEAASMLDSFRLAASNLQEVWSQVLAPGTLLAIRRLAAQEAESFQMPPALWSRIIYEFLAAHRNRNVSRQHLFGALIPLYYGWAASHVLQTSMLTDAQAEEREIGIVAAFKANKPYLISLWRWPDRFTP
ncbi:MAG: maltose alpha-D-glucosyltransferase [Acidobacteriaceae bacterium]